MSSYPAGMTVSTRSLTMLADAASGAAAHSRFSAHQSGNLIMAERSHRCSARPWPAELVRRVGVEPATRRLGVA